MSSSTEELRAFLGMENYCHRLTPHANEGMLPPTDQLRGNPRKLVLTDGGEAVFLEIKSDLAKTSHA